MTTATTAKDPTMTTTTAAKNALPSFDLVPTPTRKKDEIILATVPMPDSLNQKANTRNELEIAVKYIKDGMRRAGGRGIFLVMSGYTQDGPFRSCLLFQDPSIYIQVEPCARFSKAALEKAARRVCEDFREGIEDAVKNAHAYYVNKTAP